MRYIYYCNSAYQLILIMNLHWQRKYEGFEDLKDYDADIIILNAFDGADEIVSILNENKIFEHAYLVGKIYNSGIFHAVSTALDVIFPMRYLKRHGFDEKEIANRYDALVVPKYNQIMAAIWQLNKKAKLHLIEDGVGTYFLATDLRSRSSIYKILYRPFNHGKGFTDFDHVYLNRPELFIGQQSAKAVRIPVISGSCQNKMRELFDSFVGEDRKDKDMYWLGQYFVQDDINNACRDCVDVLRDHKQNVLFCPHPRHPLADDDFELAPAKRLWELQLLNMEDLEEKCMMTFHSTACVSPKLLYDKEPYIIFAYPFVTKENIARYEEFYRFMDSFRKLYREPEKIMLPRNKEEFAECVRTYLSKK